MQARRSLFARPTSSVTSSSRSAWMNSWIRSRAIASSCSQIVLDPNGASVLFSSMGGVSFLGRIPRLVVADQEGYAAFSSFTHLLRLPQLTRHTSYVAELNLGLALPVSSLRQPAVNTAPCVKNPDQ